MRYPTWTIYTDNIPVGFGGYAKAFVIFLRTKYRDDDGIHAHESEHVRQWYVGVMIGILAALAIASISSVWWPLALTAGCALHPLAYQMQRMVTKTRPKFRKEVIEDCLDLNAGQMNAALYGAVQRLMAKVAVLEARLSALEAK